MKRLFTIFLLLFFIGTVFYSVCVYGKDFTSQSITVAKFHTIDFDMTNGKLYLKQGKKQSVEVKMSEKQLSSLHTDVKDGVLTIYLDGYQSASGSEVYVTVEELKGVHLTGSNSDIIGEETIKCDEIEIKHNFSPGDINLKLEANKISAELGSSGDIILSGKAKEYVISLAGSGDIKSFDLTSDKCTVSILGSGDAEVNVVKNLIVSIMGSGGVTYKGKPALEKKIFGSGFCKEYKQ